MANVAGVEVQIYTRGLTKLDEKFAKATIETIHQTANWIVEKAKELAPVGETGNLRESIRVIKMGETRTGNISYRIAAGDENTKNSSGYDYTPFVEFGTRFRRGRFFMTRALEEAKATNVMKIIFQNTAKEYITATGGWYPIGDEVPDYPFPAGGTR